jgi:hypothetical protein
MPPEVHAMGQMRINSTAIGAVVREATESRRLVKHPVGRFTLKMETEDVWNR